MDPQIFTLITQRSDSQDKALQEIKDLLEKHIEKDERYWEKVTQAEAQISLLKWMFGGSITTLFGSFVAWIITNIKG